MLVENVALPQTCNHVNEGELMLVEEGNGWERAREEREGRDRCSGVELLQSLEC